MRALSGEYEFGSKKLVLEIKNIKTVKLEDQIKSNGFDEEYKFIKDYQPLLDSVQRLWLNGILEDKDTKETLNMLSRLVMSEVIQDELAKGKK